MKYSDYLQLSDKEKEQVTSVLENIGKEYLKLYELHSGSQTVISLMESLSNMYYFVD